MRKASEWIESIPAFLFCQSFFVIRCSFFVKVAPCGRSFGMGFPLQDIKNGRQSQPY